MKNPNIPPTPPSGGTPTPSGPAGNSSEIELKKLVAHIEAYADQVAALQAEVAKAKTDAEERAQLKADQEILKAEKAALERKLESTERMASVATPLPQRRIWQRIGIVAAIVFAALMLYFAHDARREAARASADVALLRDEFRDLSERQQLMRRDWQRFLNNFTANRSDTP